jgi:hypothetical protein
MKLARDRTSAPLLYVVVAQDLGFQLRGYAHDRSFCS